MSAPRLLGSVVTSWRHRISGTAARLPPGRRRAMAAVGTLSAAALVGFGGMSLSDFRARKSALHRWVLEDETAEGRAMKKRFEEWMVKHGRMYKDEEEKAMRYEIFRRKARSVDEHNAMPGCSVTRGTHLFADREEGELCCCYGNSWYGRLRCWLDQYRRY
uniref:Uncharacterized protein n=1 Tax=Avena sativa TaxID=4498 RepID=A0ACD5WG06_AVESA